MITTIRKLEEKAKQLRRDIITQVATAQSGHPAGALGMADIFAALYFNFLKVYPEHPLHPQRDYLVLSNGHICAALYAALARKGFFSFQELKTFRKFGSRLQGHPHRGILPGIETSSGPLGSGLSQAAGMALGLKLQKKNNRVVCLTSDGEHDEGNTWEAVLFTAKYKLPLIQIIDRNHIQIDGRTEDTMPLNSLEEKYLAFHWHVISIDGNNMTAIIHALQEADHIKNKPVVIVAHTVPGKGVSFMEHDYTWHGKPPSQQEAKQALGELR